MPYLPPPPPPLPHRIRAPQGPPNRIEPEPAGFGLFVLCIVCALLFAGIAHGLVGLALAWWRS